MTDNIKKHLKERSKLTKYFCKSCQRESDHDKVLEKSAECTEETFKVKKKYILKMANKPEDPYTALKTYSALLNCLFYNEKIPAILPLLVDGKFVSDFYEKANLFNNFFVSVFSPIKM